jgi:simple sugar transport system permease protein
MTSALFVTDALLGATLLQMTPLLLPAVGEVFAESSGVFNIGMEGVMLMGAIVAFLIDVATGNPWLGVFAGILVGLLMGFLIAVFEVSLRVNQIVFGIAVLLLGQGLSSYLAGSIITGFEKANLLPSLSAFNSIPIIGTLTNQDSLFYLAIVAAIVAWYVIFHTRLGLTIRMIGEDPAAADHIGLSVIRTRYLTVMTGSGFAALGGISMVIGTNGTWTDLLTSGRGFIILALVRLSAWKPHWCIAVAGAFGFLEAFQFRLQALYPGFPYEFIEMLPYIAGVLILWLASRFQFASLPKSLGRPYQHGER